MSSDAMQVGDAAPRYVAQADALDVPKGYKWTEIGVIPDDWQVKRLGELGQVVRGGSPRPAGDPRFFNGSFIPWLTVASLTSLPEHELHVSGTVSGLTEEGAMRSRTLIPGTLIIANSGATLGVAKMLDLKCCANDGIAAIVNHRSGDKPFLCYYVNTQTERLRDVVATGNGQPNLNTALISEIRVPFPGTAEQRAIAEALSDVDRSLGALEALIAKKRAIKQAAMQQLLTGKTRLPGFSGEWDTKRISDFADCTAGGTPATSVAAYWGGDIRWMNSGELNHKQVAEVSGRITKDGLANSSAKLLPARCVLIGLAGQGKTRGTAAMNQVELCTNQSIAAVLPNDLFASAYLYFILDARYEELRELSSGGGGRGGLNLKLIKSLEILFPSVQEQRAIATVLADMDAEIAAVEARRDKTRAIKQGMMQQLLTGRVRVVKPEATA